MSISYQCIGKHVVFVLRVFFVTRVGSQLYDLYFNYPQNTIINELISNGWSLEGASLRYLLLKSCESIIPLFALATCIAVLSRFFHKLFLAFMIVDDAESASSAGVLAGWLFIVMCFQSGITSLKDEDRYWRLLRNLGLIVIVNLHSLFKPVSDRLQSLSASRSKTVHKHARVLLVGISSIVLPTWFLYHLWTQKSINSWTLTVTVFGIEMIFRMSISLVIYAMCMINSFCDVTWRGLEDQIYYLKVACALISYLCGISLFFNGTWVLLFEHSTVLRGISLCFHLYFNIWNQAWKGWKVFNKRRLASAKMNHLRDATKSELIALDDVCSICFQELDQAKVTGCNHYFHSDCLTRWLYLQDSCPICSSTSAITFAPTNKTSPSSSNPNDELAKQQQVSTSKSIVTNTSTAHRNDIASSSSSSSSYSSSSTTTGGSSNTSFTNTTTTCSSSTAAAAAAAAASSSSTSFATHATIAAGQAGIKVAGCHGGR